MVITILAEPRSGSTNLTNWFYLNKKFTTLFEPLNPVSKWFQNSKEPKNYKYKTKHLCLKEVYYPHKDWDSIISLSDKIIVLYRENGDEQLESFLNAISTNNWDMPYVYTRKENNLTKEKTEYFKRLKHEFKEKYINNGYFTISYEKLYYNNGIERIKEYIDLDGFNEFPLGEKYRINLNGLRNLI